MLKYSLASIALAASLLTPWAATAVTAAPSKDEAQIRALEDSFAKAVTAKNVAAVMKVYSPDVFVFDVVLPRQYVGAAAYAKDWVTTLAGIKGPNNFAMKDLVVSTDGTIGYSHSIQSMSGVDAKGGKLAFTVRVSDVYRKVNGAWLIVQEHVSVPVDMNTGKPDMMSKP